VRGLLSEASLGKSLRPYSKNKLKAKRTGGMTQVAEYLSNKYKAVSSKPLYHQSKISF
jgi:hypothetical protein